MNDALPLFVLGKLKTDRYIKTTGLTNMSARYGKVQFIAKPKYMGYYRNRFLDSLQQH